MIGFLHPWALAGLLAAAIPILLHLLARREPPTVVFPAVRYLITTTREHQRRLKLQHLLLLLLRTLLIVALVFAAAGPTVPSRGVAGHAPSAMVLVVDNSPSSGVVVAGASRLSQLQGAARRVLGRATPDDALWLLTADGVPRRADRQALLADVDALPVSSRRLDLGAALGLAGDVLAGEPRRGEIALLTDLQASAVSAADVRVPLVVARPDEPPPPNVGVARLETGPQPWSADGGRLTVSLVGDSGSARPVTARLGTRPPRQALAQVGGGVVLAMPGVSPGWWDAEAELDPDELRLDDRRMAVVRVAPVARVNWDSASRFVAAACEVLETNRRIARGNEVTLGRLARGSSIVQPPEDPAGVGALNRALAARGVAWRYGAPLIEPTATDSGPLLGRVRVLKRYQLETGQSGRTGVLATVGGTPWLVRSGDVVLLGSRLDPAWTDLPVSAGFMPFMDALVNRLARGEVSLEDGAPGDPVPLPDLVSDVRQGERDWRVEGGGVFRPGEPGAYYLLAGDDTVGAITANIDPRESLLAPASDAQARRLWKDARLVSLADAGDAVFTGNARGDLRGLLLWLALLLALAEAGLASLWRRDAR
ncbi:MAG TPA: BatA domain-containing protein [Gemmatimonadales bacterium]|nr:BatA domain-containing protein [Gemmatimonadales bacterium]